MEHLNEQVLHASFGTGKIIGAEEDKITVRFDDKTGDKEFMYPEAFEQYLKMQDPSKQEQMDEEVRQKKERTAEGKRAEEQERVDEQDRLAAEKAAARKKPSRKKAAAAPKN
ncbi:hypothetical protein QWJ34_17870 [Saccharibacillus sp. CPCC 101409]|uniref:hypothetical protein n=1 Tax=Saccharibacillus sp. CPCC 101409 TaxID=3058041 RepID=UPI002673A9C3|nr:hypothetical protein [Saccharibacillus sp. CPCC 101409]MDO3411635.1 hypothetical protein [Saccharibacillus sp. CPCC 101409]